MGTPAFSVSQLLTFGSVMFCLGFCFTVVALIALVSVLRRPRVITDEDEQEKG